MYEKAALASENLAVAQALDREKEVHRNNTIELGELKHKYANILSSFDDLKSLLDAAIKEKEEFACKFDKCTSELNRLNSQNHLTKNELNSYLERQRNAEKGAC